MNLRPPFQEVDGHIVAALPGGLVLFTTRRNGHSQGALASFNLSSAVGDDPRHVQANWARLAGLVGIPAERIAHARQVHGTRVAHVDQAHPRGEDLPADGQATASEGVGVAVTTADCLPIALVSPAAVAMVHAGWRGLAGGVVKRGVAAMRALGAGTIYAAIGPGAGSCCYEVGNEVLASFGEEADAAAGGRIDLKLIARHQLERLRVEDVYDTELCTICAGADLFFSHRRDAGHTGRQAGVAWRR